MLKQMKIIVVLALTLSMLACSKGATELDAAPLGDRSVLESLAKSYTKISNEQLSVSPMSLTGEDRKRFVEKVFADSGYSYPKTLNLMANEGVLKSNQLHLDMAELILMPHRSPRYPVELTDLYSAQELQDIAVVERQLNM